MKAIGIIPARYASSRFPGKPLATILGKPMIQRVFEQSQKADELGQVIVATDDQRIFDCVNDFGGKVVMTSSEHPSGTDRVFEAFSSSGIQSEIIVNVQGDEPFINPEQINALVKAFDDPRTDIATLITPIQDPSLLSDPNKVKVTIDKDGFALYFSRTAIPFNRNEAEIENWLKSCPYFLHLGLYAYRAKVLQEITSLPPGKLEETECLEQLRWLENGYRIRTVTTLSEPQAVDTPEDLQRVIQLFSGTKH